MAAAVAASTASQLQQCQVSFTPSVMTFTRLCQYVAGQGAQYVACQEGLPSAMSACEAQGSRAIRRMLTWGRGGDWQKPNACRTNHG